MNQPTSDEALPGAEIVGRSVGWVGRLAMIGFGLFWLGGTSTAIYGILYELNREVHKPLAYVPVEAVVTSFTPAQTTTDEFGDKANHSANLTFRYKIGAQTYDGSDAPKASEYKLGQLIQVWYDPANPERSCLTAEASPLMLGFLIFILAFVAVGVNMIYSGLAGKGAKFLPGRSRSGRGMSVSVSGAGPYFGTFMVLSPVSAFPYLFSTWFIDWRLGWAIGLAWIFVGLPLTTLAIGSSLARRRKLKQEQAEAAAEAQPGASTDESRATGRAKDVSSSPIGPAGAIPLPSIRRMMLGTMLAIILWCGLTGAFAGIIINSLARHAYAKAHFLPTDGVVVASKIQESSSDDGTTYAPRIKYSYVVAGREYTSTRYAYDSTYGSDGREAKSIVDAHPAGKKITVYYNPAGPSEAVLRLEPPPIMYLLSLVIQPFAVVGLGIIGFGMLLPFRRAEARAFLEQPADRMTRIPGWGFVQQDIGKCVIQGKAPLSQHVIALASGYGVTCFIAMFALALWRRGVEGLTPRQVACAIIVSGGVGALAMVVSIGRGARKARLVLDLRDNMLTLVSAARDVNMAFAEIDRWAIRSIRCTSNQPGNPKSLRPMLLARGKSGDETPVHIFGGGIFAPAVAQRTARLLAEITHRPTADTIETESEPAEPASFSEAMTADKISCDKWKEFRDLM